MIKEITKIYRFNANRTIKTVLDFTGKHYYIEDNGNLYWRNQLLANIINNNGYIHNKLKDVNGKEYYILRHQLVAQVFLKDSFQEGMSVDHIDNDRTNDNVTNLRWATSKTQANNQIRRKRKEIIKNETYDNEQKYLDVIENEKEYFVNNVIPKFNKSNYIKLYRIYQIYDAIVYGYSEDEIISNYAEIYISNVGNFIKDREYFFNFNFEKVKDYKKDKALSVAKKSTTESVDKKLFEETFLDKVYNKSEFKNFCTREFALKSEIFKNLNTINEFLRNIGYTIKRTRNGHIVRKL